MLNITVTTTCADDILFKHSLRPGSRLSPDISIHAMQRADISYY